MDEITFKSDRDAEMAKRAADPAFNRAMDEFWRVYHTEGAQVWQCVQAALKAAQIARLRAQFAELTN